AARTDGGLDGQGNRPPSGSSRSVASPPATEASHASPVPDAVGYSGRFGGAAEPPEDEHAADSGDEGAPSHALGGSGHGREGHRDDDEIGRAVRRPAERGDRFGVHGEQVDQENEEGRGLDEGRDAQ